MIGWPGSLPRYSTSFSKAPKKSFVVIEPCLRSQHSKSRTRSMRSTSNAYQTRENSPVHITLVLFGCTLCLPKSFPFCCTEKLHWFPGQRAKSWQKNNDFWFCFEGSKMKEPPENFGVGLYLWTHGTRIKCTWSAFLKDSVQIIQLLIKLLHQLVKLAFLRREPRFHVMLNERRFGISSY